MTKIHDLLAQYGEAHHHPTNRIIHFICVPVIVFATVGLGWAVHAGLLSDAPAARWLNLGTVGSGLALAWYARLGPRALAWMAGILFGCNALCAAVAFGGGPLVLASAGLWAGAWVLQFVGHHLEGAKPAFADDLLFLLVGPLFVLDEWGIRVRDTSQEPATA